MSEESNYYKENPKFVAFVKWSCLLPGEKRDMKEPFCAETQKEFGAYVDVSEDTLSRWKKRPEFKELRQEMADEWLAESRPQRIRAAIQTATILGKEGYNDRRDLFKIDGTMVDRKETKIDIQQQIEIVQSVRGMTLEEIEAHQLDLLREMDELQDKSDEDLRGLLKAMKRLAPARPESAEKADQQYGFDPGDWRQSDEEIEGRAWAYADAEVEDAHVVEESAGEESEAEGAPLGEGGDGDA